MSKAEERTFETKDGREYTFLFDFDGLVAVEDCANGAEGTANLQQIVMGAANRRLGYLRALVFGGLKRHHPGINRAEAAALIETDGPALGAAFWPAFFSAMAEPEAGENPRRAAGNGTGTRSSPPGSRKASTKRVSASKRRGGTRSS